MQNKEEKEILFSLQCIRLSKTRFFMIFKILSHEESKSHRMVWLGRDLKVILISTPLPQAGTPSTRPGYSKSHSAWP